jgi:hypothetical protein
MAQPSRLLVGLLLSGLAACGGKSIDVNPDGGGGSAAGGSGHGGTAQGGTSHGGTAQGGSAEGGSAASAGTGQGGSAGACAVFDDEPGWYVNVELINQTSQPIYVGQDTVTCNVAPLFLVADASGATLSEPNSCNASCQLLRTQGPIGCPAICAFPSSVLIKPGETVSVAWDGRYGVQRTLPAACVNQDYGQTSCEQARAIQPGTFTFWAVAGSSIDCSQTTTVCSACTPSPNGGCSTPGSLIGGKLLKATTSVLLDGSYGVWGSPQPAPLPLPDPGSGTAAPAPQPVQLIFSE